MTLALTDACAKEPIHIPGCIQPHGVLLVVGADGNVRQASANAATLIEPGIGQPLLPALAELVREAVAGEVRWRRITLPQGDVNAFAHVSGTRTVIELEAAPMLDPASFLALQTRMQRSLAALNSAKDLTSLAAAITTEIRALTGFDRVMLYRFDDEWNGSVMAEAIGEGVESYSGQHFPASDIPAQARQSFLISRLRAIPSAEYAPSPLVPADEPIDLTHALLRSASPVHLEYLKNMGVGASLTVSLLREGRLWGLIACHHRTTKLVPHEVRSACDLVGRLASSLIAVKEENEDLDYKRRLRDVHAQLLALMADSDDLVSGLVKSTPTLLDLTSASGAAAAIYFEGQWTVIGKVPTVEQIEGLVDWLSSRDTLDIFSTHTLPAVYPPAARFKDIASGLLAISIPKSARNYILWFRPEVIQTVHWAGNPEKSVRSDAGTMSLHPRASFEIWKQVVHNRSLAWKSSELEAAAELRKAIIELDLERQFRSERRARQALESAIQARDHVLAVVSHDLRNPLGVIQLSVQSLEQAPDTLSKALPRIDRACRRMNGLVEDIMSLSKMEAGKFVVDTVDVEANALMVDAFAMLEPLATAKAVTLRTTSDIPPSLVRGDPERLMQVFSNLVGNAIKFTPKGGAVTIHLEQNSAEARFGIHDTGPGIRAEDVPHVFDRFWQARKTAREGAGLGLAIAKGIVEAHGGRIGVDSIEGHGSTFHFTLPRT